MGKSQKRHAPEFRRQMVELHRSGCSFNELAEKFGCTSWSIRMWVKQADRDGDKGYVQCSHVVIQIAPLQRAPPGRVRAEQQAPCLGGERA